MMMMMRNGMFCDHAAFERSFSFHHGNFVDWRSVDLHPLELSLGVGKIQLSFMSIQFSCSLNDLSTCFLS